MTTAGVDTKTPLERGVRDMFKPPLEREYRNLITPSSPPVHAQSSHNAMTGLLPPPASQSSADAYSVSSAPPPYRDEEGVGNFPEKTSSSTSDLPSEHEQELARVDSPCDTVGHDIQLTKAQRRYRLVSVLLCPEVMAYLMLKKRTCRRCGIKVKPNDPVFH